MKRIRNICKKCGVEFIPSKQVVNYCSYSCRNQHTSNRGRTKEQILQIARDNQHLGRYEFRLKLKPVVVRAKKLGIMNELWEIIKPKKWAHTYEECMEASLKCKTIKEFSKKYWIEYTTSLRKGWYDVMEHLERSDKNLKKRCVYVFEFIDNSVYVGLTWNFETRYYAHVIYDGKNNRSSVKEHINKTGLQPTHRIVLNYTDEITASKYEEQLRKEYEDKGYNILNRIKGGGLGFHKRYTMEEIMVESLKYKNRKQFMIGSGGHYRRAIKEGWLDEVCSHMISTKELQVYWTEERVKELIDEHNITKRTGKNGLKDISHGAYTSARKGKFLEKLLPNSKYDKSNQLQIGVKVGRLTILKRYKPHGSDFTHIDCICDCGKLHTVNNISRLCSGHTNSCGCLRADTMRRIATKS
jgi:predicted GIY-YIG superfamily endonuclease